MFNNINFSELKCYLIMIFKGFKTKIFKSTMDLFVIFETSGDGDWITNPNTFGWVTTIFSRFGSGFLKVYQMLLFFFLMFSLLVLFSF